MPSALIRRTPPIPQFGSDLNVRNQCGMGFQDTGCESCTATYNGPNTAPTVGCVCDGVASWMDLGECFAPTLPNPFRMGITWLCSEIPSSGRERKSVLTVDDEGFKMNALGTLMDIYMEPATGLEDNVHPCFCRFGQRIFLGHLAFYGSLELPKCPHDLDQPRIPEAHQMIIASEYPGYKLNYHEPQ